MLEHSEDANLVHQAIRLIQQVIKTKLSKKDNSFPNKKKLVSATPYRWDGVTDK